MAKLDLNTSDDVLIGKYNRYTFLATKTGKSSAENTELAGLQTELSPYLITASEWNNIAGIPYAVATGTANTYAATLPITPTAYVDGMALSVKINVDATAASTLNVNGLGAKALKKANGTDVTNLKANGVYTFRYNSTTGNFILQGEGGSGNAVAAHLLAGETASVDAGDIVGTMVDRGGVNQPATGVDGATPGRVYLRPSIGYYDGVFWTYWDDPDFIAANIRLNTNMFGLVGTYAGSNVKTAQHGVASFSSSDLTLTINISAIDTTKTAIRVYVAGGASTTTYGSFFVMGEILSSTQLKLTRGTTNAAASSVYWEVIEFQNIKSLQVGGGVPGGFTITAVDTTKTMVIGSGYSTSTAARSYGLFTDLNSATTVNCNSQAAFAGVKFYVIEFL